ncbi:unnamed protein product [Arabis nemorensis]|uniref:START domain-containing protein n=1 Tax=Arabis nemorensis TaxID=586526 RepID=A0A565C160_9BRAS|nr:unnamed protein product [Arabis nemorensis]
MQKHFSVDASSLAASLMNPAIWPKIFPSIVGEVSTEAQHPKVQRINVDFMPQICPLVQTRNVKLLRCWRRIETDTWVIADISQYFSSYARHLRPKFMRFPSGCLIQRITNGLSKVTVLEHWVYKEEEYMNRSDPNSTFALKWLNDLQRQYWDNTCLTSIPSIGNHIQIFEPICQTNLLKLSSIMVSIFCTGVCGIAGQKWELLGLFGSVNNIRVLTRDTQSGAPCNLVSVTGMATMQAKPETVIGLINRARKQDIWNYLQSVEDMREMIQASSLQAAVNGRDFSGLDIYFAMWNYDGATRTTRMCCVGWLSGQDRPNHGHELG